MAFEWNIRISSNALSTLNKRRFNAKQLLPLTSDLDKLSKYLEAEMNTIKQNLNISCSPVLWRKLVTVTLCRIILFNFNKRKSRESAKLTLQAYATRPSWSDQGTQELKESLSEFEIQLASRLTVVETEGKRGRKVPILLTSDVKSCIDLLIKLRHEASVDNRNPFIFARLNNSLFPVRVHDCLRKCCAEADLQSPNFITGTKLRKYVATV